MVVARVRGAESAARGVGTHPRGGTLRRFSLALNMGLAALFAVVFITGWIASWLGVTEFAPHRYSSFVLIIGVSAHLGLHWRSLLAPLKRSRNRTSLPTPTFAARSGATHAIAAESPIAAYDEVVPANAPVLVGGP